jgi:hypothetical protein
MHRSKVNGNNDPYEPYLLIKLIKPVSEHNSAKSLHSPYFFFIRGIVDFLLYHP